MLMGDAGSCAPGTRQGLTVTGRRLALTRALGCVCAAAVLIGTLSACGGSAPSGNGHGAASAAASKPQPSQPSQPNDPRRNASLEAAPGSGSQVVATVGKRKITLTYLEAWTSLF